MTRSSSKPGMPSHAARAVALVSGKGGSGKTMVAVAMAQGLAISGHRVILVDTDFATGGLSYYLSFRTFRRARTGIADVLHGSARIDEMDDWAARGRPETAEDRWVEGVRLVPVGDQRQIGEDLTEDLSNTLGAVLFQARQLADVVIVDCRGGIDKQSVAVCAQCDGILVVVETDPTSIQSSQHLMDVLGERDLRSKVDGFILNKVMDDPTNQAKTGTSLLRAEYLGAIPFDIEATRAYIQGKVPSSDSLFSRHVFATLTQLFPEAHYFDHVRTLKPEEFGTVTLKSPEGKTGSIVVALTALYMSAILLYQAYRREAQSSFDLVFASWSEIFGAVAIANILILVALSDNVKQVFGMMIGKYKSILRKLLLNPPRRER